MALQSLSNELLYEIFTRLGPTEVCALNSTCKQARAVGDDDALWHQFYKTHLFGIQLSRIVNARAPMMQEASCHCHCT